MSKRKSLNFQWTPENVSAKNLPKMVLRNYWEQRDVNDIISAYVGHPDKAAEIGAGFGRLTMALVDSCSSVIGFEREGDMVKTGNGLGLNLVKVNSLDNLPAEDQEFDFTLIFTVLQHISDQEVPRILEEAKRITKSVCLICEETDPSHHMIDKYDRRHFTHGRSVEQFEEWMSGFKLTYTEPRPMEPGFTYLKQVRETVGTYMLFERRADGENTATE